MNPVNFSGISYNHPVIILNGCKKINGMLSEAKHLIILDIKKHDHQTTLSRRTGLGKIRPG